MDLLVPLLKQSLKLSLRRLFTAENQSSTVGMFPSWKWIVLGVHVMYWKLEHCMIFLAADFWVTVISYNLLDFYQVEGGE